MESLFATEVALCEAFIGAVDDRAWTVYPETCSWDILLVRNADGFQVGIQAKLRLNTDVITQAIEEYGHWSAASPGPDCRAVMVPAGASGRMDRICEYLGLVVIKVSGRRIGHRFTPSLPTISSSCAAQGSCWHEWAPTTRHVLPGYVPDVAAGAASPLQLTEWKIKAIKLAVILERRGRVERTDFKHLQFDHRRWFANGWLNADGTAGAMPDFRKQHPRVYEEIAAEFDRWAPRALPLQKEMI